MSLLLAALELCLLLHQNHEEFAFAGRCAGVVLQLDQLSEHCKPLIEGLIVESLVRQVTDDVEKEVISGLESFFEEMIEAELAGKARPAVPLPEFRHSIEIWILPDGQARCRYVMDMFSEDSTELYEDTLKYFLENDFRMDELPNQTLEIDRNSGIIEHQKVELHDHHVRIMLTLFYNDLNSAKVHNKTDVRFSKTPDGFELEVPNSFLDGISELVDIGQLSLTLIMPGEVLKTPRGSTINGQTAAWHFDENTWTGRYTKATRKKPRKILCGPSLVDERDIAAFASERDGLKAQFAKSRK